MAYRCPTIRPSLPSLAILIFVFVPPIASGLTQPKPASEATKAAGRAVAQNLTVQNLNGHDRVGTDHLAPGTINPKLRRNARCDMQCVPFAVRIVQARGYGPVKMTPTSIAGRNSANSTDASTIGRATS